MRVSMHDGRCTRGASTACDGARACRVSLEGLSSYAVCAASAIAVRQRFGPSSIVLALLLAAVLLLATEATLLLLLPVTTLLPITTLLPMTTLLPVTALLPVAPALAAIRRVLRLLRVLRCRNFIASHWCGRPAKRGIATITTGERILSHLPRAGRDGALLGKHSQPVPVLLPCQVLNGSHLPSRRSIIAVALTVLLALAVALLTLTVTTLLTAVATLHATTTNLATLLTAVATLHATTILATTVLATLLLSIARLSVALLTTVLHLHESAQRRWCPARHNPRRWPQRRRRRS